MLWVWLYLLFSYASVNVQSARWQIFLAVLAGLFLSLASGVSQNNTRASTKYDFATDSSDEFQILDDSKVYNTMSRKNPKSKMKVVTASQRRRNLSSKSQSSKESTDGKDS